MLGLVTPSNLRELPVSVVEQELNNLFRKLSTMPFLQGDYSTPDDLRRPRKFTQI